MTAILNLTAGEIRPYDGITEGSYVSRVVLHEVERRDRLTGAVSRVPVVTVTSNVARLDFDLFEGRHIHRPSSQPTDERTFALDAVVRVARPAPMAPCSCGFDGRTTATEEQA